MESASVALLVDYAKHAALLTVGLLVYAQLRPRLAPCPWWLREAGEGLCFTLLIAVTMSMPLMLPGDVRIDLRTTLVCLSVVFGGPLCGAIAAIGGLALRQAMGGPASAAGMMLVVFPYVMTIAYVKAAARWRHKIGYGDLVAIGVLLDLLRLGVWLIAFGYAFTLASMNLIWFGVCALVVVNMVLLGSAVLLVEERHALARSVADSEARFRSVVDQLPEGLTLVDTQDRFTYVNEAWQSLTGVDAASALGQTRRAIWEKSGAAGGPFPIADRVIASGEPVRTEPQFLEINGQQRWVIGTLFPVRDASGTLREIGTTGNEVTELVLAREDLARREAIALRHKNALLEAVHANRGADRPLIESLHALTEIAGETLAADHTAIFRADFGSRRSERLDLWHRPSKRHLPPEFETQTAIWDLAENLDREGVLAMEDAPADPLMAARMAYMRTHDIRSLMVAPIFVEARFYGVLTVSTVARTRKWSAEEMSFARSMADLVALLLVTSRYRESLAALDLIEDGIRVEDAEGRVLYANSAARSLGPRPDAAAESSLFGSLPLTIPNLPQPMQAEQDRHELTLETGAAPRELVVERCRIPNGGRIVVMRDVTQRNAEQRERERLEQQLAQASKLEAIGQLAGGIAHDFNNLLGAVIGFARFLEEDLPAQSDQRQYARRILAASERGKAIVAQILAFARVRNVERHALDFRAVLEGSADLLRGLVGAETQLSFDLPAAPLPILGNEGQVTQLLVNLCTNANDALGGQRGSIAVALRRVGRGVFEGEREAAQLSLFGEPQTRQRIMGRLDPRLAYLRLDVADSGKGIPASALPHIFEPFFTTKHRQGGTGLGLAVVQTVVGLYDGVVFLDSREGEGTTFSIFLPLTDLPLMPAEAPRAKPSDGEGAERVLIVDDDIDVADMLAIGLGRLGYEVAALNDPLEALAAFREDPKAWEVAVIDRVMPEMDGLVLAQRLRALRGDLRIILCTGLDDGSIDPSGADRAFDGFYTKPVTPETIAAAIRSLLDRARK